MIEETGNVLSRSDYDALRPTLKDVLLRGGPVPADDNTLEEIIAENRRRGLTMMGLFHPGKREGLVEPNGGTPPPPAFEQQT